MAESVRHWLALVQFLLFGEKLNGRTATTRTQKSTEVWKEKCV